MRSPLESDRVIERRRIRVRNESRKAIKTPRFQRNIQNAVFLILIMANFTVI